LVRYVTQRSCVAATLGWRPMRHLRAGALRPSRPSSLHATILFRRLHSSGLLHQRPTTVPARQTHTRRASLLSRRRSAAAGGLGKLFRRRCKLSLIASRPVGRWMRCTNLSASAAAGKRSFPNSACWRCSPPPQTSARRRRSDIEGCSTRFPVPR